MLRNVQTKLEFVIELQIKEHKIKVRLQLMRVFEDITIIGLKFDQLGHDFLLVIALRVKTHHLPRGEIGLAPVTLEPLHICLVLYRRTRVTLKKQLLDYEKISKSFKLQKKSQLHNLEKL